MKIVVLDGYTLNPGDLTWDDLAALGDCAIHDRTVPQDVLGRAEQAEIVLTNKTVLSEDLIDQLPRLRYIGVLATGHNVVDVAAAGRRGVMVTHVPAYGTRSVAQMVFAHLLNFTQHVGEHGEGVRSGRWSACPDFCYWDRPLIELDGLTMGVVGFGRIGRGAAELAIAFGMKVLACDEVVPERPPAGVEFVGVDDLFRRSDVVSLHCPLTAKTERLVDAERLAEMKPTAFLINTSRGGVVDEADLAVALREGRIAGAGLDVLSTEPPAPDNPLLTAPNCCITPHIAWATRAARSRLMRTVVQNVKAFLAGRAVNVVS